jgi:hypothetical protein
METDPQVIVPDTAAGTPTDAAAPSPPRKTPTQLAILVPTAMLDDIERRFLPAIADPAERSAYEIATKRKRSHTIRVRYILAHWIAEHTPPPQ